jgi:hypothetical protein
MISDTSQTTFNAYDFAFAFWSLFTTERENFPGGIALANLEVPFLLANAAWYPKADELKTISEWYAKRDLPPAIIVTAHRDEALERTLQEGPFMVEQSFSFLPVSTFSLLRQNNHHVEQASWLQSRVTAELLASHFGQAKVALSVSQTLSKAMQDSSKIRNYIAYQDKPLAAMVTFEQAGILAAMLTTDAKPFTQTLLEEATTFGLKPYVFEELSNPDIEASLCLERWSIR